jgi:predicted nucleic acid-binding protein
VVIADTNIWIDFFNDPRSRAGAELAELIAGRRAGLTGIVMTELVRGARDNDQLAMLHDGFKGVRYIETTAESWNRAGVISRDLDVAGQPIQLADIILAAVTLTGDHELFTRDNHFQRIAGLRLYDWNDPDA